MCLILFCKQTEWKQIVCIRIYVYRHMDIFPSPEMFNKSYGLFKH